MHGSVTPFPQELDSETAKRLAAQSEGQTLREELEFCKRVHEQEMKELQALVRTEQDHERAREFWKNELGQALHEIQSEYDERLDVVRAELERAYMNKVSLIFFFLRLLNCAGFGAKYIVSATYIRAMVFVILVFTRTLASFQGTWKIREKCFSLCVFSAVIVFLKRKLLRAFHFIFLIHRFTTGFF